MWVLTQTCEWDIKEHMNMHVHMLNIDSYIFVQNKEIKNYALKQVKGQSGVYLYSFHWGYTLIEHFLQGFWLCAGY